MELEMIINYLTKSGIPTDIFGVIVIISLVIFSIVKLVLEVKKNKAAAAAKVDIDEFQNDCIIEVHRHVHTVDSRIKTVNDKIDQLERRVKDGNDS